MLRKEVFGKLDSFAKKAYGCSSVKIKDTNHESSGSILMDGKGRLVSGAVVERWAVEICGELKNLLLAFRADGRSATEIVISEVKAEK